ncbi:MAG: c-type cytochrome [Pseudomonadota bacterium]
MRSSILLVAVLAGFPASAEPDIASPEGLEGFVTVDLLPVPDVPALADGRAIWGSTCENCHGGNKLTGAPKITSTDDWQPRIAQGIDRLVTHATEGFIGPKYTQMPARGGNDDLSDDDIKAAVAFMVWASGGAELAETYAETNINRNETK